MKILKEAKAWKKLTEYCNKNKIKKVLIVTDKNLLKIFGKYLKLSLKGLELDYVDGPDYKNKNSNYHLKDIQLVVGMGGGTNIDQAKLFAKENSIKWVAFPTKPTAAISSDIASIPVGEKRKTVSTPLPEIIFIDTNLIENIQLDLIRTEFGDSLSSITAVPDAIIASIKNKTKINELLLKKALKNSIDTLKITNLKSKKSIEKLYEISIRHGEIMNSYGNTIPSSGIEHSISHAIDHLNKKLKIKSNLHGIQVGLGVLIGAYLQSKSSIFKNELAKRKRKIPTPLELKKALSKNKLPISFNKINATRDINQILKVARDIRPDKRYTVLEEYSNEEIIRLLKDKGVII